jgi:four helix bundle protein
VALGPHSSHRGDHGQDIRDRSFDFACRVVLFCKALREQGGIGGLLVVQLIDCGGSVAAMLEEARAAESRRDFISKTSIALKEAREAWVRLRICERTRCGPHADASALVSEANQIVAILTAILRRTRENS